MRIVFLFFICSVNSKFYFPLYRNSGSVHAGRKKNEELYKSFVCVYVGLFE